MKSRCPNCQTVFRVTPEQLKARAGKVRCGQCQAVFNALDSLLEEEKPATHAPAPVIAIEPTPSRPTSSTTRTEAQPAARPDTHGTHEPTIVAAAALFGESDGKAPQEPSLDFDAPQSHAEEPSDAFFISSPTEEVPAAPELQPVLADTPPEPRLEAPTEATVTVVEEESVAPRLSESAVQELGKASGLIMPRETTEIPGYSKWSEGVIAAPVSLPPDKPTRWPFVLVALLLVLALAGQVVFHFRSEIATTLPSLRPWLVSASQALGRDLPLLRHVELISIEVSDLQNDPAHGNLLVLNATLRNRAAYGQAYPSLELSLTDTQDTAIARRVFSPAEYLPAKTPADQPFAANSDLAVRLWIEARDIAAAGYRLYVFYP